MKAKRLWIAASLAAVFSFFAPVSVYAESDGGNGARYIYVAHDYYIPYIQGMDDVYGAYRAIASRGEQDVSILALRRITTPGENEDEDLDSLLPDKLTDDMSSYYDSRTVNRDDIFIFTELPGEPDDSITERYFSGNDVYIVTHRYFYERPVSIAGYSLDMNPLYGSSAVDRIGSPWTIAIDGAVMKAYMPEYTESLIIPNRNGVFPRGAVIKSADSQGRNVSGPYMRHGPGWTASDSSASAVSGGASSGGNGGTRYCHILSLAPTNENNVDFVGWWDIFSQATLSSVDSLRAEIDTIKDEKQPYDTQIPASAGASASALAAVNSSDSISIYFEPSDFDDYKFDTKLLSSGAPGNLWAFSAFPGYDTAYGLWNAAASAVRGAVEDGTFGEYPANASALALAYMSSGTPGFWTPPRADLLENASAYIYADDPDSLGVYPMAKAASDLYFDGKLPSPALSGQEEPDPYEALSGFLGAKVSGGDSFTSSFRTRVASAPFAGRLAVSGCGDRQAWSEPWIPTDAPDGSIWNWWRQVLPPLYKHAASSMSIRLGTVISGIKGVTAWNKGVENQRAQKEIARASTDINKTADFSSSEQSELKNRNISDESQYVKYSGETADETIGYMKLFKREKAYDFGTVKLSGTDETAVAYNVNVKYYPVYATEKMSLIKRSFPFLGVLIAEPDYRTIEDVHKLFPLDSEGAAGLDETPPTWDMEM